MLKIHAMYFFFLCHNCAPISSLNNCKAITNALLSNGHFGDLANEFSMPWHYLILLLVQYSYFDMLTE